MNYRERLKDKKRIVIKIGSSSLTHSETGRLNLRKLEVLARELSDLRSQGKDVILVSSGAVATGVAALGMKEKPTELKTKQACAAVGQARLIMIYQKLFLEYNQPSAQILMTKNTMVNNANRKNAQNTFNELLSLGVIPIVNENDSISTYELQSLEIMIHCLQWLRHWCRQICSSCCQILTDFLRMIPISIRMPDLLIWWRIWMRSFWRWENPHPRALWEPEEWLPSLRLPGLPLLQEWIWSLPMELISILSTRSQRAVTTVPYLWVSPEKSFILSILLINYYKNTGGIYLWRQKRLNGSMHWHIRRKA